jgi:putative SOS response-associated peptidase YedK
MCFNYAIGGRKAQYMGLEDDDEYRSMIRRLEQHLRFTNGFEHPKMPVVTAEKLELYHWGLIPPWVKTQADASQIRKQTLNAMSETVFEKPSFRNAIKTKRCLVPATGFFEWRHVGKLTFPYYVTPSESDMFFFAGIHEEWTNKETGEIVRTYSILTTQANALMELIHNTKKRMPVILKKESEKAWLDNKLNETDIKELCKPYPEELILARTIARLRSRANTPDTEKAVEPVEYFELSD